MTIEKGIPIPPDCRNGGKPRKYPFDEMEIGDSFLCHGPSPSTIMNRLMAAASNYRKRNQNEFKIATRSMDDGVRVWRIK